MKCPNDGATLLMTDKNEISIDYCPECRGVWLDKGKLEKIIERSGQSSRSKREEDEGTSDKSYKENEYDKSGKKKKGGFLDDILGNFGGD